MCLFIYTTTSKADSRLRRRSSVVAVLNVLSPVLVAALYPNKIGMMSSAYLLSSTIFSAASAGFSAPLANILGWPVTLQVLTVFPVVTLIVAIAVRLLPGSQQALAAPAPLPAQTPPAKPQQPVWRQPLATASADSQSARKKEAGFFIRPLATGIYLINRKFRLVSVLFVKSFHDFPGSFRNVGARAEDGHSSVFLQEVIVLGGNNTAAEDQDIRTAL